MGHDSCMRYTLRGIPKAVDKTIRQRAWTRDSMGLGEGNLPRRDLADVVGTWVADEEAEAAFKAQDRVEKGLGWLTVAARQKRKRAEA